MTAVTPARRVRSARRELAIYLVGVVVLSAPLEAGIIFTRASDDTLRSVLRRATGSRCAAAPIATPCGLTREIRS